MNQEKLIRVVDTLEWFTGCINRIKPGTRGLWLTACRTLIPVEILNGLANLQVKSIATDDTSGKTYGIYIEQVVELEFDDEIVRLNRSLLNYRE